MEWRRDIDTRDRYKKNYICTQYVGYRLTSINFTYLYDKDSFFYFILTSVVAASTDRFMSFGGYCSYIIYTFIYYYVFLKNRYNIIL